MKKYLNFSIGLALFSVVGITLSSTASATGDVPQAVAPQVATAPVAQQATILPSQRSGVAYVPVTSSSGIISSLGTVISPCTLYPSPFYERNSGGVGTKPYTNCSVPVTSITHDTVVEKQSEFGYWEQVGPTFHSSNNNQFSLSPTNVQVLCTNTLYTNWDSYTNGTVVYQGVTFHAFIRASNGPIHYYCGT